MQEKNQTHQQAQDLYLHTGKTQQEIADILNVNRKTIYLWIKNGKWQEMKKAADQTPGMMRMKFYNFMTAITSKVESREDQCPTPQEVNMLHKLMKMDKMIAGNHAGAYIQAFEELTRYISGKDNELCKKMLPHIDNYIIGTFGDDDFHLNREISENISKVEQNLANREKEAENAMQPGTEAASPAENPTATPPANPAEGQETGAIAAQKGQDEATVIPAANTPETNTGSTQQEKTNTEAPQNTPQEKTTGKETIPAASQAGPIPPEHGISPYRTGNILWINHISDLDDYDDHRKMGDIIRYYPGMSPYERQKRA
jgi:DNA-binding XRE family transcriptional regulator